jgi:hypothetical protein
VQTIVSFAFADCDKITDVTILATDPPFLPLGIFPNPGDTLHIPAGTYDAYNTTPNWSTVFTTILDPNGTAGGTIPNSTISISDDLTWNYNPTTTTLSITGTGAIPDFANAWHAQAADVTTITIADGITSIGWEAFYQCPNLTSVTLPASVTYIEEQAFKDCGNLTTIDLSNVQTIGLEAFYGCEALTTINLSSVQTIGQSAFIGCAATSVTIGPNVTSISDNAFVACTALTDVTILATDPPTLGTNNFISNQSADTLHVPTGYRQAYVDEGWLSAFHDIVEEAPAN